MINRVPVVLYSPDRREASGSKKEDTTEKSVVRHRGKRGPLPQSQAILDQNDPGRLQ